jgi:ketosteroid isomerase-like protein
MTTGETVHRYFSYLKHKSGWESFLSDDLLFTSFTSPVKQVSGRQEFLASTKGFYSMINSVEVRELIVDGDTACALTRYELQPPHGPAFESNVAEVFEVRGGKIGALAIYFDSAPFRNARPSEP